jgi:hypothetical protein
MVAFLPFKELWQFAEVFACKRPHPANAVLAHSSKVLAAFEQNST